MPLACHRFNHFSLHVPMLLSIFHFKLFDWNAIRWATWLEQMKPLQLSSAQKLSFNCKLLFSWHYNFICHDLRNVYDFTKWPFAFETSKWSTSFETEVKLKRISSYGCKWCVNNGINQKYNVLDSNAICVLSIETALAENALCNRVKL